MPRMHCLHTADSNAAVFDAAWQSLGQGGGVALRHHVRADLLAAEAAGGLTPGISGDTQDALRALCAGADAVLLTCSTLGPAADALAPLPVLRVDAALARAAVAGGGAVVALCAVATTLEPTRALFGRAAGGTGAVVTVQLVPGAWDLFKAGDGAGYLRAVARAADAVPPGAVVALAQASMAGAAALCARPVLASPAVRLAAALAAAGGG